MQVYSSLLLFNFEQTLKKYCVAIPTDVFCCWGHHKGCSCNRYNSWANLSRKTVMSHINIYCVLLDFICFYYFWCVFMTSYPGTLGKMVVASVFLSAHEPFWQDLWRFKRIISGTIDLCICIMTAGLTPLVFSSRPGEYNHFPKETRIHLKHIVTDQVHLSWCSWSWPSLNHHIFTN